MKFDYAISFAGPQRELARDLYSRLKARGTSVFFDEEFEAEMLGQDGAEYFTSIFYKRSRECIALISRDYEQRPWCQLERRAAQARELDNPPEFFIPVLCEPVTPPWLLPTRVYFDLSSRSMEELVDLLVERVGRRKKPKAVAVSVTKALTKIVHPSLKSNGGAISATNRVEEARNSEAIVKNDRLWSVAVRSFVIFVIAVLIYRLWFDSTTQQGSLAREGAFVDPESGLMWTQFDNDALLHYPEAVRYCGNLDLRGFQNWRLPTSTEFSSLQGSSASYLLTSTPERRSIWLVPNSVEEPSWDDTILIRVTEMISGGRFEVNSHDGRIHRVGYEPSLYVMCVRWPTPEEQGYLKIDTTNLWADEASVYLNGKMTGLTPRMFKISPGIYNAELESNAKCKGAAVVDLKPGESRWLRVELRCPDDKPRSQNPAPDKAVGLP